MSTRALAQTYEPNPLLAYVYRRFFEHIHVDETWVATVRDAAARGSVVYILRNLSFLDFLALDHLTKRHGLPRIRFANDLGLWVLEPMGKGWFSAFRPQSRGHAAEELTQVIEHGGSAALFLKRPSAGLDVTGRKVGARRSLSEGDDLIRALFALQRGRSTPILLVPQVFVWTKSPDRREGGVVDALLGSRE
jgi:glycerol-3-phosphate O-acyltransferase